MRYLIIGLGIYGSNLAMDLTGMGHEVIGADRSGTIVESIKDYISTAYILDSTDRTALSALPLNNVDTVIVAIGENFGASIRTVALLKELNVKHIFARCIDPLHESILQGFHIDRILTPEQRAAYDLTHELEYGPNCVSMKVDDANRVVRFDLPSEIIGVPYGDITAFNNKTTRLIAVTRPEDKVNRLGMSHRTYTVIDASELPGTKAAPGDVVTVLTNDAGIRLLTR